jgi:UDP-glucose 4-epimerase
VGVKLIIEEPVKTIETIFHPTDLVLRACSKYRRPVLLTSTSEVYGRTEAVPFREDDDVVMGPTEKRRWAYACAKALDEFVCLAHFYETNLPVFIVRLFNTVGPRQVSQYGMVLPTFVRQALEGKSMTVYGDGSQQRCFCSVHDVVAGLMRLPRVPSAAGKVVNLGSQEEVSIRALAQRVRDVLRSDSEIVYIPYEEAYGPGFDDMRRRIPDLTRAKDLMRWAPKHTIEDIILEVAAHMRVTDLEARTP